MKKGIIILIAIVIAILATIAVIFYLKDSKEDASQLWKLLQPIYQILSKKKLLVTRVK